MPKHWRTVYIIASGKVSGFQCFLDLLIRGKDWTVDLGWSGWNGSWNLHSKPGEVSSSQVAKVPAVLDDFLCPSTVWVLGFHKILLVVLVASFVASLVLQDWVELFPGPGGWKNNQWSCDRHLDIYNNYSLEGVFASIATLPMLRKLESRQVDCEEKQLNQVLSRPLAQSSVVDLQIISPTGLINKVVNGRVKCPLVILMRLLFLSMIIF